MTVTCPKCAKSLKVKDEHQGKMLKCPQCATAFRAGAAKPAGAAAVRAQPKPGEKAKPAKAGVSINWGPVITIGFVSLIPIGIAVFLFGPMRVKRHWDANQQRAEEDVRDVLDHALKCQASAAGLWNPRKAANAPSVVDLRMMPDVVAMSVPAGVRFDGFTSNGTFEGTYAFASGEVDARLKLEGLTLASGIHLGPGGTQVAGGMRSAASGGGVASSLSKLKPAAGQGEYRITGRANGGNPAAELDGKPATIYYPPELDEDGNVIEPATPTSAPVPTSPK